MTRYRDGGEAKWPYSVTYLHNAICMGVGLTLTGYDPDSLEYYFANLWGDTVTLQLIPIEPYVTEIYMDAEQGVEMPFDFLNKMSQGQNVVKIFESLKRNLASMPPEEHVDQEWDDEVYYDAFEEDEDCYEEDEEYYDEEY